MNMTPAQFGKALKQPYAWPGGYPTYFVTSDGVALCHKCAIEQGKLITAAIRDRDNSGWRVVAQDINYEDSSLYCDHCSERVESAYAEDEAKAQLSGKRQ